MVSRLKRNMLNLLYRVHDQLLWRSFMERRAIDYERVAYMLAAVESATFFQQHMPMALNLVTRSRLLDHAIKQVETPGLWLEFGVYKGDDLKQIARQHAGDIYGFDSFEGLPEDWTHFQKKGRFSLEGALPSQLPSNAKLVQGWFDQTLPGFLNEHEQPIAFLHIDSDLYSSAKTVLELVHGRLRPGTIIQFDDFINYPGWKEGEHKAFQEFVQHSSLQYEYIGFASTDQAVALRVIDIQPPAARGA
jgi:hypothetical protein